MTEQKLAGEQELTLEWVGKLCEDAKCMQSEAAHLRIDLEDVYQLCHRVGLLILEVERLHKIINRLEEAFWPHD